MLAGQILLLLGIINGAPIILNKLLGHRYDCPVDGGWTLPDGNVLFGPSKTWRGLVGAMLLAGITAKLLGFTLIIGLMAGCASMTGDLFSSFVKRRLGIRPSGMALGLDQIPESLFPLLLLREAWGLSGFDILTLVATFLVLELILSRCLYTLGIRKQPY